MTLKTSKQGGAAPAPDIADIKDVVEVEVSENGLENTATPSRKLEVAAATIAVVLMAVYVVLVLNIELRRENSPGQMDAKFWPLALGSLGLVIAIWRLIVSLVAAPDERDDLEKIQAGGVRRLLWTLLAVILFLSIWQLRTIIMFGYYVNLFVYVTPVLLAGLLWIYGARRWKTLVIYPIVTTAFIYGLFGVLLRIPL